MACDKVVLIGEGIGNAVLTCDTGGSNQGDVVACVGDGEPFDCFCFDPGVGCGAGPGTGPFGSCPLGSEAFITGFSAGGTFLDLGNWSMSGSYSEPLPLATSPNNVNLGFFSDWHNHPPQEVGNISVSGPLFGDCYLLTSGQIPDCVWPEPCACCGGNVTLGCTPLGPNNEDHAYMVRLHIFFPTLGGGAQFMLSYYSLWPKGVQLTCPSSSASWFFFDGSTPAFGFIMTSGSLSVSAPG